MNESILNSVLISLISIPFECIFLYVLTKTWRFSGKTTLKLTAAICFLITAVNSIIFTQFGITLNTNAIVMILILLETLLGYLLLSSYNYGRSLFICLSVINFLLCILALGEVIVPNSPFGRFMYRIFLFITILYLLIRYFRHPLSELTQEFKGRWHQLAIIPFMISVLISILLYPGDLYYNKQHRLLIIMLTFSTFFIYIALYHIFSTLKKQFSDQTDYAILKEQMISLEKQTVTIIKSDEQINIFRHDIRHYTHMLHTCLKENNIETAEIILETMNSHLLSIESSVQNFTGSVLVDAILSSYYDRSVKNHIRFEIHFSLADEMKNDLVDFAIVIANGLENAFNACMSVPEDKERIIIITGKQQAGIYFFSIENTYNGDIQFQDKQHIPVSTKRDHGYGTKSIQSFAEKQNAYLDLNALDGWFTLRLFYTLKH